MKKIMIMCMMLVLTLQTVAFAEESTYDVTVDGQLQKYVGVAFEDGVYIPYAGLVSTIGEKELPLVDKSQLSMVNINGFDYISSDDIQGYFDILAFVDDDDRELKMYSYFKMLDKIEELEAAMKVKAPDLYAALKKTMEESYSFTASVNGVLTVDYRTEQMQKAIGVNNAFLGMDFDGYINTIKEDMELSMGMKLDAMPLMSESIQDIGIKKIGEAIYVHDPTTMTWTREDIDTGSVEGTTVVAAEDSALLWLLAENMERTVYGSQVIYKSVMTEDNIEQLVDDAMGPGVYAGLKSEIESSGFSYVISDIHVEYVLEKGVLSQQSILIQAGFSNLQGTANLVIGMDVAYSDYGLNRDIEVPIVTETSEPIQ